MKTAEASLLVLIAVSSVPAAAAITKKEVLNASAARKEDLFRKVDALASLKTLTQKSVSKGLGMTLEFADASRNVLSKSSTAHGPADSAIELIEIRGEEGRFLTMEVSSRLAITGEDIRRHFGKETDIYRLNHHAPPDSPLYLIYSRPKERLKFGIKVGKPDLLIRVVLDRTEPD